MAIFLYHQCHSCYFAKPNIQLHISIFIDTRSRLRHTYNSNYEYLIYLNALSTTNSIAYLYSTKVFESVFCPVYPLVYYEKIRMRVFSIFILYPKALQIAIMSASWINTALWFLMDDLKNTYEVEFLTFTQRWLWKWKQNHSIFNSIFIYNYWLLYCVYFHALKTPRRLVVLWHHRQGESRNSTVAFSQIYDNH